MKRYSIMIITSFIIAVIWGYFADLKNGQIGGFIGRIVFVIVFTLFIDKVFIEKKCCKK